MKSCSNKDCNEINPKPLTEFSKSKRSNDGLQIICKKCQASKTREWYSSNKEYCIKKRSERFQKNKLQDSANVLKWQRENPDKLRGYHLKRKYGITLEQYNGLFINQNGLCKICNKTETAIDRKNSKLRDLAVDHCHKTKQIRGLLCTCCNTALGLLKDNIELLEKAITYLEKSKCE